MQITNRVSPLMPGTNVRLLANAFLKAVSQLQPELGSSASNQV